MNIQDFYKFTVKLFFSYFNILLATLSGNPPFFSNEKKQELDQDKNKIFDTETKVIIRPEVFGYIVTSIIIGAALTR
jgi:hypothetical protein